MGSLHHPVSEILNLYIFWYCFTCFYLRSDFQTEIAKVQQCGRIPLKEQKYVDIYREKQIRVTVKVLVPVKEHPKVNLNE